MRQQRSLFALLFSLLVSPCHPVEKIWWNKQNNHDPTSQQQKPLFSSSTFGDDHRHKNGSQNDASCVVTSHATRYSPMARGRNAVPIIVSATTSSGHNHVDWEQPAISPTMNSTAGEQWEFDGVSASGQESVILGLYRDPNYAFLGTGNLRAYLELTFANGERYAVVDYAEESTIWACGGGRRGAPSTTTTTMRGLWKGPGFEYRFEVAGDGSWATWTAENDEISVVVEMDSISKGKFPDNSPLLHHQLQKEGVVKDEEGEKVENKDMQRGERGLEVVPHFFWVEPVPTAETQVDIVRRLKDRDNKMELLHDSWDGIGGHERLWTAFNWRTSLHSLKIVRLQTGPLSLSFWEFGSGRDRNLKFSSVAMFENGEQVFGVTGRTRRRSADGGHASSSTDDDEEDPDDVVRIEQNGDRFVLKKLYEELGTTTENLKDKVTGVQLLLEQPSRGLKWGFDVTFTRVGFEFVLTEGRGGTGYAGTATSSQSRIGQDVSGSRQQERWAGPAFVEIMKFPDGDWWLLPDNYVE